LTDLALRLGYLLFFSLLLWGLGFCARAFLPKPAVPRPLTDDVVESAGLGLAALILIVFVLGFFDGGLTSSHLFFALGLITASGLFLRFKRPRPAAPTLPPDRLFLLLGGILLVTRLIQIRGLLVPNWVDGLNHQLLLQRWDGLATISSDRLYHAGFHMAVLALHYLTGWNFPALILSYGQWLGLFFGLSLYVFLKDWLGRPLPAFLAALTSACFLLFPNYLVSWGRYPLLQGLALLPFSLSLTRSYLRREQTSFLPPLAVLVALVLSHYGMALFWFAFVLTQIANLRKPEIASHLKRLGLLLLPLFLALLPRLILLIQRPNILLARGDRPLPSDAGYVWQLIVAHDWPFLLIGLTGLALAVRGERRVLVSLLAWVGLVFAVAAVQVHVLGSSAFGYENVLIFLSLPLGLLAGLGLEQAFTWARSLRPVAGWWTLAVAFLALVLWRGSNIINPETVLFTPADRVAFAWVDENIPPKAIVLVNSAWWGDRYAPSDGGAWLSPLTGRDTVIAESAPELAEASQLVERSGVGYVYIGGGYGELSLAQFMENPSYEVVYQSNGVTIYRVVP
jgi:hypothetical protein